MVGFEYEHRRPRAKESCKPLNFTKQDIDMAVEPPEGKAALLIC